MNITINTKAESILWCNVYVALIVKNTPAFAAKGADKAVSELRMRTTVIE